MPAGLTRREVLKGLAAAGIGVATGASSYGYAYERHHVGVTHARLDVSGLPLAQAGLRIGFITDIHRSATGTHELVAKAVELVMAERPDLIVLGGDYVTNADRRYMEPAADALAPLAAPHGIFAVMGNHDDDRDMPAALVAKHFTVLRDSRTRTTINGEAFDIAGIRYWTHRIGDITRVLRGASPNVMLLAHTPKRLIEAAALSVPLMLSGHTHGGQIVLPALGPIAAREFPVIEGPARRENTAVFVSRGVGTVYVPVRINCPPEVAILTLQPREHA
jgi:predicted MPP superfamily phosphohydrolase